MHWSNGANRRGRDRCGFPWTFKTRFGSDGGAIPTDRLRRLPERGYLGGVCAGIAERAGVEPYLVRLGFVGLGLFSGPFVLLLYFILLVSLPRAAPADPNDRTEPMPAGAETTRRPEAEAGHSPAVALAELRDLTNDCERRVAELERHVTTQAFTLHSAFRDLDADDRK